MKRSCFICNGCGQICNKCGEAENACSCKEPELMACTNCGGDGIAPLDKNHAHEIGGEG